MSVNGVTGGIDTNSAYNSYASTSSQSTKSTTTETATSTQNSSGVIYEPSTNATASSSKKTYKPNAALIASLKSETAARTNSLANMVSEMLSKQSNTYGTANNMWSILAKGNTNVDAKTRAQAQTDIGEDGYWGVSSTSKRILDFATALTGGDPDKIEEMRAAFEKGFKKAEKTWGGKLPDISQQTFSAVMSGFDKLKADAGIS